MQSHVSGCIGSVALWCLSLFAPFVFWVFLEGIAPVLSVTGTNFFYTHHLTAFLLFTLAVSVFCLPLWCLRRKIVDLIPWATFAFFMVLIYFFPLDSRRGFLLDLYSVEPGMTSGQAKTIMQKYEFFSGVDQLPIPLPSGEVQTVQCTFNSYKHSDYWAYDADRGAVFFKDNKVIRVTFSSD